MAVNFCSKVTLCTSDEDCSSSGGGFSDALCFPDISCSLDAAEWSDASNEDFNINSLSSGGGGSGGRGRRNHYYWSGVPIMMILLSL